MLHTLIMGWLVLTLFAAKPRTGPADPVLPPTRKPPRPDLVPPKPPFVLFPRAFKPKD